MTLIRRSEPISRKIVEDLLLGTAPERIDDMRAIWEKYDPKFFVAEDGAGATLSANSERVIFDNKTLAVYWLLSFAGWRALECYSPAVVCSLPPTIFANLFGFDAKIPPGITIADVLGCDLGLAKVEASLDDKVYAARSMLRADSIDDATWPKDIPPLGVQRESLSDPDKATFDLAVMSTAYAFCHELSHIMFAKDGLFTNNKEVGKDEAKQSRPEEELACDVWARDFLISRLGVYAAKEKVPFDSVLAKRSIAAAIGIFVLYETTERHGDAGTEDYPPLADRIDATLRNTKLETTNKFWIAYACVLLAILRRRNKSPRVSALDAKQLCELLVEEIRQTS